MSTLEAPARQLTADELVLNNMGLVGSLALKISQTTQVEYMELFQEGSVGLIKAARTFDPHKGVRFSTYANRCIQNEMLVFLRGVRRASQFQRLDSIPDWWNLIGQEEPDMSFAEIDSKALACMTDKQKQLVVLLYKGYSQREAADQMGHTPSYISKLKTKARTHFEQASIIRF